MVPRRQIWTWRVLATFQGERCCVFTLHGTRRRAVGSGSQDRVPLPGLKPMVRSAQFPLLLPPRPSSSWLLLVLRVMFLSTLWTAAKWRQGSSVSDWHVMGWLGTCWIHVLLALVSHSAAMHGILGSSTSYCTGQSIGLLH